MKPADIALWIVLGAAAGIVYAFIAGYFHHKYRHEDEQVFALVWPLLLIVTFLMALLRWPFTWGAKLARKKKEP